MNYVRGIIGHVIAAQSQIVRKEKCPINILEVN